MEKDQEAQNHIHFDVSHQLNTGTSNKNTLAHCFLDKIFKFIDFRRIHKLNILYFNKCKSNFNIGFILLYMTLPTNDDIKNRYMEITAGP